MLSIGKITPFTTVNKKNINIKRKEVSFTGGFHLEPPQKFQFFNNVFTKEKTLMAKNLKDAVESIPSSGKAGGSLITEACEFFRALKVISEKHPEKNLVEVLCEHFSIGTRSFERDYVNEPFEKHFNVIEQHEEYSDFVETLTKGLYDEVGVVAEQNSVVLPSQVEKFAEEDLKEIFANANVRSTIDTEAITERFEAELDVVLDKKVRSIRKYTKKVKKPLSAT